VTDSNALTIDSASKAGRYLSGLGGSLGFDEAIRRVEARSSQEVRDQLRALVRWVKGESTASPGPEFRLIGTVVRNAPADGDVGKAIAVADRARADARVLADHVRSSMLDGIPYLGLLLAIAGIVAAIWVTGIAPNFGALYSQMQVTLPTLSRVLVDQPWIIAATLVLLALVIVAIVVAARRLARSVESVVPLGRGLVAHVVGQRVYRAHESWCILSLARAWAAAGEDPARAAHRAAQALDVDAGPARRVDAEMRLAADLGAAAVELEHMAQTSATDYRDALDLWRAVVVRTLQIAIAVVVGLVVIAVYLPIFRMGAIV